MQVAVVFTAQENNDIKVNKETWQNRDAVTGNLYRSMHANFASSHLLPIH